MSTRKIASNLLWTPQGVVRDPLVTLRSDGVVLAVESCPAPDRVPFVEFHSGVLVLDFPTAWRAVFAQMLADTRPLDEQLRELTPATTGVVVVLRGLDYNPLRLTLHAQIFKL